MIAVVPADRRMLGFPPNLLLMGLVGQPATSLHPDGRELVATYYIRELEVDVWRVPNGATSRYGDSLVAYIVDVEGEELSAFSFFPSYEEVSVSLDLAIARDASQRATGSDPAAT